MTASKKPTDREIEGVIESILHCTMAVGADPQQHARAAGFSRGYWGYAPLSADELGGAEGSEKRFSLVRAHTNGHRVGEWFRSLAAAAGSRLAKERGDPSTRKTRPRRGKSTGPAKQPRRKTAR